MSEEQQEKRWTLISMYAKQIRQSVSEVLRDAMHEPLILGVHPRGQNVVNEFGSAELLVEGIITLGGNAKLDVLTSLAAGKTVRLYRAESFVEDHADPPPLASASSVEAFPQTGGRPPGTDLYVFPDGMDVTLEALFVRRDPTTQPSRLSGRDEAELNRTRVLLAICLEIIVDQQPQQNDDLNSLVRQASRYGPDVQKAHQPKTGAMAEILEQFFISKLGKERPPRRFSSETMADSLKAAIEHFYEVKETWD